jgi:hypothetical protein
MAGDSPALEQHHCDAGTDFVRIADIQKVSARVRFDAEKEHSLGLEEESLVHYRHRPS